MHGLFKGQMRRDVVNGHDWWRITVIFLKEIRDKSVLLIYLSFVGFQWRNIGDAFDVSDAVWKFGKGMIDGSRAQGFEVSHSKSPESSQFVLLDSELYDTVCEKAYRKSAIYTGKAKNRRTLHALFFSKRYSPPSAEPDDFTMWSKVSIRK